MNEHEIMNSELALNEVGETLPVSVTDETSGGIVKVVKALVKTGIYVLATWKGVEIIVNGYRKLRDRSRSRKQAKEVPSDKADDGIEVPEVDEHQFD